MQMPIPKLPVRRLLVELVAIVYPLILLVGSLATPPDFRGMAPENGDKVAHLFAYFLLALGWYVWFDWIRFRESSKSKNLLIVAALVFVYGIIIEVLQEWLTPYRNADLYDMLANSCGIIMACLMVTFFNNKLLWLKSKF